MRGWLGCVALVAAAACGRIGFDPVDSGAPTDTRLKRRWFDFDGTRSGAGYLDSLRGELCTPLPWDDGNQYCTPSASFAFYQDVACTIPIGWVAAGQPASDYFIDPPPGANKVRALYTRGPKLAATAFYQGSPGACVAGTPGVLDLYALGTEVGRGELVALHVVEPATGERLAQRFLEADDGVRIATTVFDRELATEASIRLRSLAMTSVVWTPNSTDYQVIPGFSDPACTAPVASVFSVGSPEYFEVEDDGCPVTPNTVRQNLGATGATSLFENSTGTCAFINTTATVYAAGPPLSVVVASRHVAATGRRIEAVTLDGGGLSVALGALYDTTAQTECSPNLVDAVTARCGLRAGGVARSYFTDAACTGPIELFDEECGGDPLPHVLTTLANELYELGPQYAGTKFALLGPTCVMVAGALPSYQLGARVTLEPALGTLVIDP